MKIVENHENQLMRARTHTHTPEATVLRFGVKYMLTASAYINSETRVEIASTGMPSSP